MKKNWAAGGGRRLRLDPRLVIGVVLVAASIAGVVAVVSANDDSVPVYAAAATLTPGSPVDADDLVVTRVRLDAAAELYIGEDALPDGALVARTVREGELVPLSAITLASSVGVSPVVISVDGTLAASVIEGADVDVWAAAPTELGGFGSPAVLVSGVTVARVTVDDGLVAGTSGADVEILVEKGDLAAVLAAIAEGDSLSLIPVAVGS